MKNSDELYKLRYPIGEYTYDKDATDEEISEWIYEIEILPAKLKNIIETLTGDQLNTPYRPSGWKVHR